MYKISIQYTILTVYSTPCIYYTLYLVHPVYSTPCIQYTLSYPQRIRLQRRLYRICNPVVHPTGFVLCYTQTFYCNKVSVWEPYFLLKVKPRHAAIIFNPVYRFTMQNNTNFHTVIFSLLPYL